MKTLMRKQLFKVIAVNIPHAVQHYNGWHHVELQHVKCMPFMHWPNGKPCSPINMYFLDIASETTGETLKAYSTKLTHLVRYCGDRNKLFEELRDADIFELAKELQREKRGIERARNNNTIREILGRCIVFLVWFQKIFMHVDVQPLIGDVKGNPKIKVKIKVNPFRGKAYYVHRAMPPMESRDPKHPVATTIIECIEECIDELSLLENQETRFLQRYKNKPDRMTAELEYLRCRRHFMVWLMKRTGLRPAEMVDISVQDHLHVLKKKIFRIPIKKRRADPPPLRSFPVVLQDATTFLRYLTARSKFVKAIKDDGVCLANEDSLFIGVNGEAVKKTSLERDFARIVKSAGLKGVDACFSMFRHRFITYEVIVHLKAFMNKQEKGRHMMTREDYESILKRVATKTGHASVDSLWHYIDLAWEEIDVWGNVDRAIERFHAADRFFDELLALKLDVQSCHNATAKSIIANVVDRLGQIIGSNKPMLMDYSLP